MLLIKSRLLLALLLNPVWVLAQPQPTPKAAPMSDSSSPGLTQIRGRFEVRLDAQAASAAAAEAGLGRMSLFKQFHGALQGSSRGEMLAFRSATPGSAGYVAMETVVGSLDGREGSFVLQHSSTMARGEPHQSIEVVPDSGTGALAGLRGRMRIDIVNGEHFYVFDYALPER